MNKREIYEKKAETLILPIITKNNYELVDVEFVKEGSNWYLRAYVDKEGGFTVNDCEKVSREFSDLLDEEDFIEESYILEVSSPGLGRPLKKDKDFERSLGEEVEVKLYKAIEEQKEFSGTLDAYDEMTVTLEFENDIKKTFERKNIALIRLAVDF
ncbi:MAG: ribosome maturation factor RimP [Catonella sp.]|uniref:ribosome maturation factor RimP n=1 Tax=Catonella sp. TaxID=2382125 RepID=UPI003FA0B597